MDFAGFTMIIYTALTRSENACRARRNKLGASRHMKLNNNEKKKEGEVTKTGELRQRANIKC